MVGSSDAAEPQFLRDWGETLQIRSEVCREQMQPPSFHWEAPERPPQDHLKKRVKGHSEKNDSVYLNNTLRKVLTRTEHICNPVAPLMQEGPLSSFMLFTFIDPLFFRFSEHLLHAVRKRQARCQVGWFASFPFNRSMIQRFTGAIEVKEELRALEMQIKIKLNQETEDQTHQTWYQCQVFLFSLKVWNHLLKSFQIPLQNCCCNWQSC